MNATLKDDTAVFIFFLSQVFCNWEINQLLWNDKVLSLAQKIFYLFIGRWYRKIGFNLNWKNNLAIQLFHKLINCKRGSTLCRVTRGMHMSDCMNDVEAPSGQGWKEMWIRTHELMFSLETTSSSRCYTLLSLRVPALICL